MSFSAILGYSTDALEPPFLEVNRLNRANEIVSQLVALDQQIVDAMGDSMALKVGELTVDFQRHIKTLRGQGSLLLNELSAVVGLPLLYNKYTGRGLAYQNVSQQSVISFY